MNKSIFFISILMISNIYAQCDNYNQSQCSNDVNCEWLENIESVTCASLTWDEELCEASPDCNYSCWDADGYFGWCEPSCSGGMTYIDNGYCQEIEMPECSEMNELECSSDDVCEWTENIVLESCNDINSQQQCNAVGCSWYNGNYYACSICCWGEYEVDNSYCEESEILACPDMSLIDCTMDDNCNWVEDIESGDCNSLSTSECISNPQCMLDCVTTYDCFGCTGGSYNIDNSYCEETGYQLGDINQDSIINVQDVILTVNLVLNNEYSSLVDMNVDNTLNVLDIIQLVNIILEYN